MWIKRGRHIPRRNNEFASHAGRAKSCKKDSCYLPLKKKREATPRVDPKNILQKKTKKLELQIQMSMLDNISVASWEMSQISE